MTELKAPFLISILLHAVLLFSIALLYQPAREALMDVTPLEFINLSEEGGAPKYGEGGRGETELPKPVPASPPSNASIGGFKQVKAETVPLEEKKAEVKETQVKTEEKVEESEPQEDEINPVQEMQPASEKEAAHSTPVESSAKTSGETPGNTSDRGAVPDSNSLPGGSVSVTGEFNIFSSMVRTRIEKVKSYPRWARENGFEGVVGVSFVILPDGSIGDLKVVKPCHCDLLNRAACEAIKRAAPFNPRPKELEGKEMAMEIDISFRLE